MDYELAKKLKEAGFPQIHKSSMSDEVNPFSLIYPENQQWFDGWPMRPAPDDTPNAIHVDDIETRRLVGAYLPTLPELIDALGDDFGVLERSDDPDAPHRWMALSADSMVTRSGDTPEEAVAKLWIALTTKD